MARHLIEWETYERIHNDKSSDWFWAVGIIAVSAAVTSIIFNNVLFALVILIGTFALTMHAVKEPPLRHYQVFEKGVAVDEVLYPFENLESFWVEERFEPATILLKSKKLLMPLIVVPISEHVDPDAVRDYLAKHLPAEEHHEPFLHKLFEYLGF